MPISRLGISDKDLCLMPANKICYFVLDYNKDEILT